MVLFIWIVPVLFLIFGTLVGINLTIADAEVARFLEGYLAITGVFAAVLVAIVTWIQGQGVGSRQTGFSQLRSGISKLSTISCSMRDNVGRASPEHQQLLGNWATATDGIIEELNEITPLWEGWERDKRLERLLSEDTERGAQVLKATGAFLPRDPVWSRIWTDIESSTRDVLIGLYWLSEGARASRLFHKLVPFLVSAFSLLILSLIGRVVLLAQNVCDKTNSVLVIFFALLLVFHLLWLGNLFWQWWSEQRCQEKAWTMTRAPERNT